MPVIFEQDGFRFGFYSNDHRPIHVHVRKAGAEAIFDVEDQVELRESQGFKVRDLARAEELAQENRNNIIKPRFSNSRGITVKSFTPKWCEDEKRRSNNDVELLARPLLRIRYG